MVAAGVVNNRLGIPILDLNESFRDGLAFIALVAKHFPEFATGNAIRPKVIQLYALWHLKILSYCLLNRTLPKHSC